MLKPTVYSLEYILYCKMVDKQTIGEFILESVKLFEQKMGYSPVSILVGNVEKITTGGLPDIPIVVDKSIGVGSVGLEIKPPDETGASFFGQNNLT